MKKTAWAYYSGADDELTLRESHSTPRKIWFRPRVLVDVEEEVDSSTSMIGRKCSVPFYVAATALGKLGDPEVEVVLTRAAGRHGVIQMIPNLHCPPAALTRLPMRRREIKFSGCNST